jgi:coenzyme F420 hydrogenase subunit beta
MCLRQEIADVAKPCGNYDGICYELCPRSELDLFGLQEAIFGQSSLDPIGIVKVAYSLRSSDPKILSKAQEGGAVTGLILHCLKAGQIDAAVLAKPEGLGAKPIVATTASQVLDSAGSKYVGVPMMIGLKEALDSGYSKIAFVGLPCHMHCLRKLELMGLCPSSRIRLRIGLFCMEAFRRDLLTETLSTLGIPIDRISKLDIKAGELKVIADKEYKLPIKKLRHSMRENCNYCIDFTGLLSDISCGSIGSNTGYTTVLIRTDQAKQVVDEAIASGEFRVASPNLESVRDLAKSKLVRNLLKLIEKVGELQLGYLRLPADVVASLIRAK